jgi:monoamine oxidase
MGYEVTVMEARDRLGGRVHTLQIDGQRIEAGGELIGSSHGEWLRLATHYGLTLLDVDALDDPRLYDAIELRERTVVGEEARTLMQRTEEVIARIGAASLCLKNWREPWNEPPDIQALDLVSFSEAVDAMQLEPEVRETLELLFQRDNVAPLALQSWLGILCQVAAGGGPSFWDTAENYVCKEGNQTLCECMAKDLIDVRTGCVVQSITTDPEHGNVLVSGDGFSERCDFVVLTTPNTTWNRLTIAPLLDLTTSYTMASACAMKFIARLRQPIWTTEEGSLSPHCHSVRFGEGWDHPTTEEETGKSLLYTVFTGGDVNCAAFRQSGKAGYETALASLYGREAFTDAYIDGSIIDWSTERHTAMAYSYAALGQMTTTMKNLNSVVVPNRMTFAGEATNPNCGYMVSALESGLWAAQRAHTFLMSL